MTGYAVSNRDSEAGSITLEIKSVNSRFLDLQFRINDDLRVLEPMLREAISARVSRGKVECRLSFGRKERVASLSANEELLAALHGAQQSVLARFPEARPLSVNELLRWPGVLHEAELGQDSLQADVQATLKLALDAFVESRQREGAALMNMLLARIDEIEAIVARITPLVPAAVEQFQQKAIDRLREAMGLAAGDAKTALTTDEMHERIRQEVTLYGIRVDVAEELTRLSGHLAETREILKKVGRSASDSTS